MSKRNIYISDYNNFDCETKDFSQWIKPVEARRMSMLLKRAVASAESITNKSALSPDAVIVATGYGCWSNTEKILQAMSQDPAAALPTAFMQSTHNTVASLLAIRNGWHAYNSTVSAGTLSVECAFMEAWTLMQLKKAKTVLVGAYDEVTQTLEKSMNNEFGQNINAVPVSTSFLLTSNNINSTAKAEVIDVITESLHDYPVLMERLTDMGIDRYIEAADMNCFSPVAGGLGLAKIMNTFENNPGKNKKIAWVNTSNCNIMAIVLKSLL